MQQVKRRWQPGETVLVQDVWRGLLWTARPMLVVEDSGERVVLWTPKGTSWKGSVSPSTRSRSESRLERVLSSLELGDWELADRELGLSLLWFLEADTGYAITLSWSDADELGGWYVNLQEPMKRTDQGFLTMDLMLDIIIRSDGTWFWKDEDEFEAAVERGLLDKEKAGWLRAQGLSAIRRHETNQRPFSESWPAWRPDPSWSIPMLPANWDKVQNVL